MTEPPPAATRPIHPIHRPPAPDRYAEAVRARRAELRTAHRALTGSHRADVRAALAVSRLATAVAVGPALAALAAEAREHVGAGRAARERLPGLLGGALARIATERDAAWAVDAGRALRRVAAEHAVGVPTGWPHAPRPGPPPVVDAPAARRSWDAPGAALWRPVLLLPPAALSLLGAGPTGRALLPLAVGTAVLAVALAVAAHRSAAERARWTRHVESALAAARTALDADLARRTVELERTAIADLDAATARRRAAVDAELARLAVDPVAPGG